MNAIAKIKDNFSTCGKNKIILIAVAVYILMVFSFMTNNPDILYSRQYFYFSIIFIPLVSVGVWAFKTQGASISGYEKMFATTMIGLIVLGIYLYVSKGLSILEIKSAFTIFRLLEALIILVLLAIVFRTAIKQIDTESTGWFGFFIELIFYIPCLISDAIDYMKEDYKNTPTTVFILFVILILVSFIYAGSYLLQFNNNTSNIVILDKPTYLNTHITPLSKKELNKKIIETKPFYERYLYTLQEKETVKYELSFNTSTTNTLSTVIPAYVDKYTRPFYIKESFTTVMTDETIPIHLTIDDYDKYILQQAMWTNPEIEKKIKNKGNTSDNDIGNYINDIVENQKALMSFYEKTMLYLATFNNSNFSKNFVQDLNNNNII